jgi:hypothetical protein|nr:MAG TPA: hypothetical protein [Bacteriophage sp.]
MLLFNRIKEDIKRGYEYYQYGDSKYKGYNVFTSLEEDSVVYFVTTETQQVTVLIPREYFMHMTYRNLINIVMAHIYFNMVDKLED